LCGGWARSSQALYGWVGPELTSKKIVDTGPELGYTGI